MRTRPSMVMLVWLGIMVSTWSVSLPVRLSSCPLGVTSKKDIGLLKILVSRSRNRLNPILTMYQPKKKDFSSVIRTIRPSSPP